MNAGKGMEIIKLRVEINAIQSRKIFRKNQLTFL
jgi:hypothetical protein